jgi:hypothetical protein
MRVTASHALAYLFHMLPITPTFPYESWSDCLLAVCASSPSGRFRACRLAYRCVWDDCVVSVRAKYKPGLSIPVAVQWVTMPR